VGSASALKTKSIALASWLTLYYAGTYLHNVKGGSSAAFIHPGNDQLGAPSGVIANIIGRTTTTA
jgi:hypothetical protein